MKTFSYLILALIFCCSMAIANDDASQKLEHYFWIQDSMGNLYEIWTSENYGIQGNIYPYDSAHCGYGSFLGWFQISEGRYVWFEFAGGVDNCCSYYATYGEYDLANSYGTMHYVCDYNNDGNPEWEGDLEIWQYNP